VWGFRPQPVLTDRFGEVALFRSHLANSLRAGHGLGAGVTFRLESGPEPALFAETESTRAARWAVRVLFPSYAPHQWKQVRREPRSPVARVWFGKRLAPWPTPFRSSEEPHSLADSLALALAVLPLGVSVGLSARPLPASLPSWWESSPRVPSPDLRPRPAGFGGSRSGPSQSRMPAPVHDRTTHPLFWDLTASVEIRSEIRPAAERARILRTIENASRDTHGNGLALRTGAWVTLGARAAFPVSDGELALVLPGPACPAHSATERELQSDLRIALGRDDVGRPVGPQLEPRQGRHLAILGETGMGKSSLLVALALQARRSAGIVLFDPLGETAEVLAEELPARVGSRVVRIDPARRPLAINALDGIGSTGRDALRSERRLNDLVHALRRVRAGRYSDSSYWGPRIEEMLTRALRAAAAFPQGTLTDAHTLLATRARVHRDLPSEAMGPVHELADRIRERPEDAEGARRLLYEVVRNPVLERMLCARNPEADLRELVKPDAFVLISGAASEVGETSARYLLSVYLALVWCELLARDARSKIFVVLDEAQWFAHESLAEMLRLGRRANVHVVLATQAVASLPESVAEAVWTNVADFVAFRGSPEEAREVARVARGVSTDAILSLPRGHAVVLLGKGHTVRWLRTARVPARPAVPSGADTSPPDRPITLTPDGSPNSKPCEGRPSSSQEDAREVSAAPTGTTARSVPDLVRLLSERARQSDAQGFLRVSLEELRALPGSDRELVRSVGAVLGRAGAILATERTDRGSVWVLATHRIPDPFPAPGPVASPSRTPQLY
jgi:energy-coupling factor transporter ATP-binding protein EcfA2